VKLLLDGHIKKAAVAALQRRCPGIEVAHLADWRGGVFRTAPDADILGACFEEGRSFVSCGHRSFSAFSTANRRTRRCTDWRPRHAVRQFGYHGGAAIGELIVRLLLRYEGQNQNA